VGASHVLCAYAPSILRQVLKDNKIKGADAKVRKLIKAAVAHAKSVLNPCKWGNLKGIS